MMRQIDAAVSQRTPPQLHSEPLLGKSQWTTHTHTHTHTYTHTQPQASFIFNSMASLSETYGTATETTCFFMTLTTPLVRSSCCFGVLHKVQALAIWSIIKRSYIYSKQNAIIVSINTKMRTSYQQKKESLAHSWTAKLALSNIYRWV